MNDLRQFVLPAFQDIHLTWHLIKKAILKYNLSSKIQDIGKLLLEYTKVIINYNH